MNTSEMGRALGVTPQQVRKYRTRGMPMTSEKSARAWLKKNSLGRFAEKAGGKGGTATGTAGAHEGEGSTPAGDLEGLSQAELTKRLTAARIRLTQRDAAIKSLQERQAQVDGELRDGLLVKADLVKRVGFERAVTLRNKLLALPAEWALQLAAMTDPAMVADFTRKRLKQALIEYCAAYGVQRDEDAPERSTA